MSEQDLPPPELTVVQAHRVLSRGFKAASSSLSDAQVRARRPRVSVRRMAAQRAALGSALRQAVQQVSSTKELALLFREQGDVASAQVSEVLPQQLLDELDVLLVVLELDLHLLDRIRQRADVDYAQVHQLRLRLLESITKNA